MTSHILITGGAGDIGGAIAVELASGNRFTLLDVIDTDNAKEVVERVTAAGAESVTYVQADVRDRAAVTQAVGDAPDVVIACAAVAASHPFLDITGEVWDDTLGINLTGCFNVGQAASRAMVAKGSGGLIVFIGSWVQRIPWPDITAYTVSKAGLEMLAKQMARELAVHGIRVNVVAPGIVDAGVARRQRQDDPAYAARIKDVIPLDRLQTAEEVAKVVKFVCSDDAGYLTGTTIVADGGCSLFQFDR